MSSKSPYKKLNDVLDEFDQDFAKFEQMSDEEVEKALQARGIDAQKAFNEASATLQVVKELPSADFSVLSLKHEEEPECETYSADFVEQKHCNHEVGTFPVHRKARGLTNKSKIKKQIKKQIKIMRLVSQRTASNLQNGRSPVGGLYSAMRVCLGPATGMFETMESISNSSTSGNHEAPKFVSHHKAKCT